MLGCWCNNEFYPLYQISNGWEFVNPSVETYKKWEPGEKREYSVTTHGPIALYGPGNGTWEATNNGERTVILIKALGNSTTGHLGHERIEIAPGETKKGNTNPYYYGMELGCLEGIGICSATLIVKEGIPREGGG